MANRILGIIGWIGTAAVVSSVAIWVVTRTTLSSPPVLDQYRYYLAWTGLAAMLVYMLGQWRDIAKMFSGRQARYGTLSAVSVVIVVAILTAVNYIGKQQNKRWDLTAAQQFSLSDQSRNVLGQLKGPLHIMVFAQETGFQPFRDRLQEYEYASSQVSTEYVDPDKRRAVAQQNGVQQYGTLIFTYEDRTERTTANTEQDITNTILKVVSGEQKKVYFTQGHGEKSPTSSDRDGYNTVAEGLKQENYLIDTVVLAQTGAVPDDAAIVVVAGPRTDFLAPEVDALRTFLGKAGKLVMAVDPVEKADATQVANLIALAHEWGIDIRNNVVVDVSGMGQLIGTDASVPVAANYPAHPITDRFAILTAYPLAREVAPVAGGVEGRTAQTFVESSPRSWAESDIKSLLSTGEVAMDEAQGDKPGPISLAAAVSSPVAADAKPDEATDAPVPEARVVVFGDSDFASNAALGIQGNRDLFMNAVGWASQQESLIAIRPRQAEDRRITLTAAQQSNILLLSLFIIPGVVFGTGVYSWWRRR